MLCYQVCLLVVMQMMVVLQLMTWLFVMVKVMHCWKKGMQTLCLHNNFSGITLDLDWLMSLQFCVLNPTQLLTGMCTNEYQFYTPLQKQG